MSNPSRNHNKLYYLSNTDAKKLVNLNVSEKIDDISELFREKDIEIREIPNEIIELLDIQKIKDSFTNFKDELEKKEIKRAEIDPKITKQIQNLFPLPIKEAGNSDFWNGMCILIPEISQFINYRMNYEEKFFCKDQKPEIDPNNGKLRNFFSTSAPTSIVRNYLALIWWISKLIPEGAYDTIWKQQDTAKNFIQRVQVGLDENEEPLEINRAYVKCLNEYEDDLKDSREGKLRDIMTWISIYARSQPVLLMDKEKIEKDIKDIFEHVINDYKERKKKKQPKISRKEKSGKGEQKETKHNNTVDSSVKTKSQPKMDKKRNENNSNSILRDFLSHLNVGVKIPQYKDNEIQIPKKNIKDLIKNETIKLRNNPDEKNLRISKEAIEFLIDVLEIVYLELAKSIGNKNVNEDVIQDLINKFKVSIDSEKEIDFLNLTLIKRILKYHYNNRVTKEAAILFRRLLEKITLNIIELLKGRLKAANQLTIQKDMISNYIR